MTPFEQRFSERAKHMEGSEIRRLFRMSMKPGMISFAGGLPDPGSFPSDRVAEILSVALRSRGEILLQYGAARGDDRLIEVVLQRMRNKGVEAGPENVLITSGAQQVLDLAPKVFTDPGDPVLVEAPTFIGALGAFRNYRTRCIGLPMEEDGINLHALRTTLDGLREQNAAPKFLYTMPNFQNPSGITMSQAKRRELLNIAREADILILEDDAYSDLWFEGTAADVRPIKALDEEGWVIYAGSFSKIVSPGIRLGWALGAQEIIDKFEMAKQMMDVCPSPLTQTLVVGLAEDGYLDRHILELRNIYRRRRDAMLDALDRYMPEGVHWTRPKGGFYIWITLPENMDALDIFPRAIENNVAYVIGQAFFADKSGHNTLRVSFCHETEEIIEEGIRRLSEAVKQAMCA